MTNFTSVIRALALAAVPALAACEPTRVIDGDTLELDGERVRIHGIDAPELKQTCERYGVTWPCGAEARKALAKWIAGRDVECEGEDRDKAGQLLAKCSVDGQDVGDWMVSRGLAIAYYRYSDEYQQAELEARLAKQGMWAGEFIKPWNWRRDRRE